LFKITSAPITPGIHPQIVNKHIITIDPHPLSKTARGGNKIDKITLNKLMVVVLLRGYNIRTGVYRSV